MIINGEGGAIICGFVARPAETRFTATGKKVVSFSAKVASGDGDGPDRWIKCVVWEEKADIAEQITKGDIVFAVGKLVRKRWTGSDGEERTTEELTCDFIMLNKPLMVGGPAAAEKPKIKRPEPIEEYLPPNDDDLPF